MNKTFLRTAIGKDTLLLIKPFYSSEIGILKTVYVYHVQQAEFGDQLHPVTPSPQLPATAFIVIIVVVCFSMNVQPESSCQTNEIGSVCKRTFYNSLKT